VANRLKRAVGALIGVALFYAPFALVAKLVGALVPVSPQANTVSDVHSACLRMPIGWLAQPWMWSSMASNVLAWLPILVLPAVAVSVGPMFCGWVCPAGMVTEGISRAVPSRFQFDFARYTDIVALRYGFFAGFLLAPFVASSICCSFCNFTQLQNLVGGLLGDFASVTAISTMGMLAAFVWIIPLGMFTVGGRGWCLFLCPAGAIQGLAAALSARLPFGRRVRHAGETCTACSACADGCTMRAVAGAGEKMRVDAHLCVSCLDCVRACPSGSMTFGRPGR
jgi:ferredoxin-type protein NapH